MKTIKLSELSQADNITRIKKGNPVANSDKTITVKEFYHKYDPDCGIRGLLSDHFTDCMFVHFNKQFQPVHVESV